MPDPINSLHDLVNSLFGFNVEFEDNTQTIVNANDVNIAAKNRPARVGLSITNTNAAATLLIRKNGMPSATLSITLSPGETYVTDPRVDFDSIALEHQITSVTAGATYYVTELLIRRGAPPVAAPSA